MLGEIIIKLTLITTTLQMNSSCLTQHPPQLNVPVHQLNLINVISKLIGQQICWSTPIFTQSISESHKKATPTHTASVRDDKCVFIFCTQTRGAMTKIRRITKIQSVAGNPLAFRSSGSNARSAVGLFQLFRWNNSR